MLTDAALLRLSSAPLRFCATETCDVVYYGDETPVVFHTGDLAVPVFQKRTDSDRLVCYCFEHSVRSIDVEIATSGTSSAAGAIVRQCRAGLDDCARKNPQGRCCLGNVRRLIRTVQDRAGFVSEVDAAHGSDCCADGARSEPESE